MNGLSTNIHLMFVPFFRPEGKRSLSKKLRASRVSSEVNTEVKEEEEEGKRSSHPPATRSQPFGLEKGVQYLLP